MSRDFKPRDVAMAKHAACGEFLVVRIRGFGNGGYWSAPDGWPRGIAPADCEFRPLVMIDPEDREQVGRLLTILHGGTTGANAWLCGNADRLTAALREFANPTPPKCAAALIVAGEHFACVDPEGHGGAHRNPDAEAVWGGEQR